MISRSRAFLLGRQSLLRNLSRTRGGDRPAAESREAKSSGREYHWRLAPSKKASGSMSAEVSPTTIPGWPGEPRRGAPLLARPRYALRAADWGVMLDKTSLRTPAMLSINRRAPHVGGRERRKGISRLNLVTKLFPSANARRCHSGAVKMEKWKKNHD